MLPLGTVVGSGGPERTLPGWAGSGRGHASGSHDIGWPVARAVFSLTKTRDLDFLSYISEETPLWPARGLHAHMHPSPF